MALGAGTPKFKVSADGGLVKTHFWTQRQLLAAPSVMEGSAPRIIAVELMWGRAQTLGPGRGHLGVCVQVAALGQGLPLVRSPEAPGGRGGLGVSVLLMSLPARELWATPSLQHHHPGMPQGPELKAKEK